ncbi:MAG: FHA domain-containing protein [Oligoflexia bacterium]|nr:FHA domain-containing protein [Oligoflexia bacterium]
MYRMTIVAGPNSGTSYPLEEGETVVGRGQQSSVLLSSSRVSKRHCVLIASNGELVVRDEGSANGTFVNGALVKSRSVSAGDRISVGEYVFEISNAQPRSGALQRRPGLALEGLPSNVLSFPSNLAAPGASALPGGGALTGFDAAGVGAGGVGVGVPVHEDAGANAMPNDLKGKAVWYFENYVMPIFYGFNLKHEWRMICAFVFMGFLGLNLVISVQPLLDANYNIIINETGRRAAFMASEIAERNAPILAAGAEGKTDIGLAENAENVNVALLLDLDQRIIAPAMKAGQFMVNGEESRQVLWAIGQFRKGAEREIVRKAGENVVAVAPVKVFDQRTGKNNVVAVAVVAIDSSIAAMSMGDVGVVYSETLILTALVGALMLFILYRLTLKPLQILNEDMDKVLKGEMTQVSHEFKFEELNSLWDLINSALQRIPRRHERNDVHVEETRPEAFVGPLKMLAEASGIGLVVCGPDRKIVFANSVFEDLSGIRADSALGQQISEVARDQSLAVLAADLFDRVVPGGDPVSEDYDFSGVACTVQVSAFGGSGDGAAKAYAFSVTRKPE